MTQQVEQIILGGGCFWCLEAAYQQVTGVTAVVSGYAGGRRPDPSYDQVCTGTTGHAEVVAVSYDPQLVSLHQLLEIFWVIHNPTTSNRQGYDVGSQYRSIIIYANDVQLEVAKQSIAHVATLWDSPITTELVPLEIFYPAEAEHQNYFKSNPSRAYCQAVINPKLAKLRAAFAAQLKPDAI